MQIKSLIILIFRTAIILIALSAFFCSCSCNWHLDKAKKKCGYTTSHDTISVHDTLRVPEIKKDTVFHYYQKDTVIIHEGKLTMKYFYNNHDSTVFLSGKVDTVYVVSEVKVPCDQNVFKYQWLKPLKNWLIIILIAVCAILAFLTYKRSGTTIINNDHKPTGNA